MLLNRNVYNDLSDRGAVLSLMKEIKSEGSEADKSKIKRIKKKFNFGKTEQKNQ